MRDKQIHIVVTEKEKKGINDLAKKYRLSRTGLIKLALHRLSSEEYSEEEINTMVGEAIRKDAILI